ncbi:hypothetical protein DFH09DRAFT_1099146 [Mycena vulgaris]|nr:hypothetical protein DFH09DRAFT_1099146 [Mycena vulgaris]
MLQTQYMAQLRTDDYGNLMVAQGLEKRKLGGNKGGLLKDGKSQKVGVFMLKIQGIILLNYKSGACGNSQNLDNHSALNNEDTEAQNKSLIVPFNKSGQQSVHKSSE